MGYEVEAKYYIEDDFVFTQDNVKVHNLFVRGIPSEINDDEILAYFEKFGKVVKIQLIAEKKSKRMKNFKSATILFADALIATKVLLSLPHVLRSKHLHVTACESWDQPGACKPLADILEAAEKWGTCDSITTSQSQSEINILSLNDDCLHIISKYLDIHDQVRMALTCRRFSAILEMCTKVKHKVISLEPFAKMTQLEIREFFLVSGSSIEVILDELPENNKDFIVEMISNNCPNVKDINIPTSKLETKLLHKLFANKKKLYRLNLRACGLNDNAVLGMQKLCKLEKLNVSRNLEITGKNLSRLTTVRELNIEGCTNFQTSYFIDIIKSMKDLKYINMKKCTQLEVGAYQELEKNCAKLELLRMPYPVIPYGYITRLPSLKGLELNTGNNVTVSEVVFRSLAENKSTQLEYLKITARNCINLSRAVYISRLTKLKNLILTYNEHLTDQCLREFCALENLEEIVLRGCIHITNVGLLSLMKECTKMKRIDIQLCPNINNHFIFDVIKLLRERYQGVAEKPKPVVFDVHRTGINQYVMQGWKCRNASSLIKLSFYSAFFMEEETGFEYLDEENFDEIVDGEDESDDAIDFVPDVDSDDEPFHMRDFSDMEDNDFLRAFGDFGRF